jgi:hypothetical protein
VAGRFDEAAEFISQVGLAYLFGGRHASDLPNLHEHLTGRDHLVEWEPGSELVWECRTQLPMDGGAWFGEWLRGRATFVAIALLPSALAWSGRAEEVEEDVSQAWDISADAGMIYEAILSEGPIASMALRRAVGLDKADSAAAYQRALRTLQRGLFITTYGHEHEQGAWASSAYEPTVRAFPGLKLPDRLTGLAELTACVRRLDMQRTPLQVARLFHAPVDLVREAWM